MDRSGLKRSDQGFTLVELVIAIVLSAVVLLSASNLMINFGKFSANVVKSEASLMGTALGSFEEIVGKITNANEVAINKAISADAMLNSIPYPSGCAANGSCIQMRISPTGSGNSSDHSGDTVYIYWQSGTQLFKSVGSGAGSAIANDISSGSLSFVRDSANQNHITVTLETKTASGTKEHLVTTAIMRSRSAT